MTWHYSCNQFRYKETASIYCDKIIYAFLIYVGSGNVLDPSLQPDIVDKWIHHYGLQRADAIIVLKQTIYCIQNSETGSLKESIKETNIDYITQLPI